ncbi:MAG: hypothetical protein R3240_12245 [Gammaproteobacteria bacterium]|nr:hypothetical protein [Gammaproteobacteria bacterium]
MEQRLFKILLLGTILTGVIAFLIINFSTRGLDDQRNNIKQQVFQQKIWMEYQGRMDRDSPRGAMVNDLKAKLLAEKPSMDEVLKLLGFPEMDNSDNMLSYHLGMWSNNRRTTDSLDIYFDQNKRVERVALGQH